MTSRKLASATILAIAASLTCAAGANAAGTSGAGSVEVRTPSLDFGRAVLGDANSTTKNVELYNGTSSTLQLTEMTLGGAISDFIPSFSNGTTCPTPGAGPSVSVAPGATCAVTVTYAPETPGPVSALLNMTFCPVDTTTCLTTSDVSLAGEGVNADTLSLSTTLLTFTSTPLVTTSPAQTVTLTNGSAPMLISGLTLGGAAPRDFVIGHDGCTGTDLAPEASCTFDVSFAPSQAGPRAATVTVAGATVGNPYPTMTLTGVGDGVPATTPTTPTTPGAITTTPAGTTKPAAATKPSYQVELVTCRTVTRKHGHSLRTSKLQRCAARRIRGSVTFTATATTTRAAISRGAVVYATGFATSRGAHGWQLLIHTSRSLRPGVYTLTLQTKHGARRLTLTVT